MKKNIFYIVLLFFVNQVFLAQGLLDNAPQKFTKQDSLRGSITPERAWWNLLHYHLKITVNPADSTLTGTNTIRYKVLENQKKMQLDLQQPMQILKIVQNGVDQNFMRDGNVFYIDLKENQTIGETKELQVVFGGKPKVAVNPPWDGGITWSKDKNGKPFIASSCQGLGASVWWPNKDHMYDEVDSMQIEVTVPKDLVAVSNGKLQAITDLDNGTKTFSWQVKNPINNYGVNINIGDYSSFSEIYKGEKGDLLCDYYVLKSNLEKAKTHFKEVPKMLKAFEHWFGPYPFYEDSYKLVEAPYLGMEHQSSVTYGNGYANGYRGRDISGSGWGLRFDYIIVHESGHEWFANNITYKDIADMWIHESFTCYSESLFVEYYFGKEAANQYLQGQRQGIENKKTIIGVYNVNQEGSSDMYDKGANMLHSLRQIVNDDQKWRALLRSLNLDFYHQTVTSAHIETYIAEKLGINLDGFFDQYLRDIRIPVLEYQLKNKTLKYRFANCVAEFKIPIRITANNTQIELKPSTKWQTKKLDSKTMEPQQNIKITVDPNVYITSKSLSVILLKIRKKEKSKK